MACLSSKTIGVVALAKQVILAGAQAIGIEIDVITFITMFYGIHFGREVVAALTAGVVFRWEGSTALSGPGYWFPLSDMYVGIPSIHTTGILLSETEPVTGVVLGGQKVITVASTTNLVVGDIIFIRNAVPANSEWGRIASLVVNTSVTLEDNLIQAQTGSNIFDQAQFFPGYVDVSQFQRVRLVADNTASGQNVFVESTVNLQK